MNTPMHTHRMNSIEDESKQQSIHPGKQSTPKLDERFITNIQSKDFVLYAGLLDLAHQMGLEKIDVELIQFPTDDNNQTAICRAVITSNNNEIFSDIGDANPSNVNRKISPHIIRMASTRAKARCFRDFCNIGMCCVEELGDVDGEFPNNDFPSNRRSNRNGKQSQNKIFIPNDCSWKCGYCPFKNHCDTWFLQ